MCGIIHVKRQGVLANKMVAKRYQKQKTRGTQGFGFIELKDGKVIGEQRAEEEEEILKLLEKSIADEILFHHRTPTSTPNFIESTHPIVVKNKSLKYDYYVVHNGIINNDSELKEEHEKDGFIYTTTIKKQWVTKKNVYSSTVFNDSEAVAIDFVKSIETGTDMKARGSMALIALQVVKGKTNKGKATREAIALYFGRNSQNPLCIEMQKDFMGISSESGKALKDNILYCYDYKENKISEEVKSIGEKQVIDYNGWGSTYNENGYLRDYSSPRLPLYGHYDNETGQWIDTGINTNEAVDYPDYGIENTLFEGLENISDIDEEVIFEFIEDMEGLKSEIKQAYSAGNYDGAVELEYEYDSMEVEFEALKKQAIKNRDKRLKKNK